MSTFDKQINSFDGILSDYENYRKSLQDVIRSKLNIVFKAFFEAHPRIKTVHWRQYTPYFNDGDECVFGVHEPYFSLLEYNDENLDQYGEDENHVGGYSDNRATEQEKIDMDKLENLLSSSEEFMKAIFGDHAWVKAHANGFDVESYEHD